MSQYRLPNGGISNISFGLDKATGGYFWQEFTLDTEEVIRERDGLALTSLIFDLKGNFNIESDVQSLINDFTIDSYPSQLQINVGMMFNRNIVSMLKEVEHDVTRNMMLLTKGF